MALCYSSLPAAARHQANPLVYFDIALGRYSDAVPLGRIVMELKEDVVPKTTGECTQAQIGACPCLGRGVVARNAAQQ
jgi:hypothetical protein